MNARLNTGIYLFPDMTMLDAYGPLQFLAMVESFNTFTFAKTAAPLRSDCGAMLMPAHGFADCPPLDIVVVPGGRDVLGQMEDAEVIGFLRHSAARARCVSSVCTGALILAAAGLLDGYRATTHWGWMKQLGAFPAIETVDARVVVDRDRITGGGVTAGIDFALTLVAELVAPSQAQLLQLMFEYRPQPPFDSGSPQTAPAALVAGVRERIADTLAPLDTFIAAYAAR